MIKASNAPTVPGAKGENPAPKPVPMRTGRNGGVFTNNEFKMFMTLKPKVEVKYPSCQMAR